MASNNTTTPLETLSKDANDLVKKAKKKHDKSAEKYFLLIIFIFVCCIYYIFSYDFIYTQMNGKFFIKFKFYFFLGKNLHWKMGMFITFNVLLFLVFWCLTVTMYTNPGEIPKYWVNS